MPHFPQVRKFQRQLATFVAYPESKEVRPEVENVASFLTYCLKVKLPGDFAQRSDFNPDLLRPWLGNIMILDFVPERDDFRYRLYGSAIVDESGFDMTGYFVSEFESEAGEFFLRLYRESLAKSAIVFSINTGIHGQYNCEWHRVICPVQRDQGVQMVACNYPQTGKSGERLS